jgi:hypothetical protein
MLLLRHSRTSWSYLSFSDVPQRGMREGRTDGRSRERGRPRAPIRPK